MIFSHPSSPLQSSPVWMHWLDSPPMKNSWSHHPTCPQELSFQSEEVFCQTSFILFKYGSIYTFFKRRERRRCILSDKEVDCKNGEIEVEVEIIWLRRRVWIFRVSDDLCFDRGNWFYPVSFACSTITPCFDNAARKFMSALYNIFDFLKRENRVCIL